MKNNALHFISHALPRVSSGTRAEQTDKVMIEFETESPALDIIEILCWQGAKIIYNDPYVPEIKLDANGVSSVSLNEYLLSQADCVVITTVHSSYDYKWIVEMLI